MQVPAPPSLALCAPTVGPHCHCRPHPLLLQDMTHPSWRPLEANCYVQCAQQLLQASGVPGGRQCITLREFLWGWLQCQEAEREDERECS